MKNIVVIGAGMVGTAMAIDLATKHSVTLIDINTSALEKAKQRCPSLLISTVNAKDKDALAEVLQKKDLAICAVPGFMGFETLKTIITNKINVVDISFFPENALELDELARQHGVTAIVDCGVAPGMDNIILGRYNEEYKLDFFECLVGGLPVHKKWPFNYKAPFSPIDVIEEYTRPARYVENGHVLVKPALSDIEHIEFPEVGTLEAFNSDGLRSIIFTMPHIKNMKEKTLRYPGHAQQIMALRDAGFFSKSPIQVNQQSLIPLDFTSKVLFNEWKLGEEEPELTIMRVTVEGTNNGVRKRITYTLLDHYNKETKTSSMARSTGYTATGAANLILGNLFTQKGVFPPELIGKDKACFDFMLNYLKERGVIYKKQEELK